MWRAARFSRLVYSEVDLCDEVEVPVHVEVVGFQKDGVSFKKTI